MPIDTEKLAIVHYPHPVLRKKAENIAEIDDEVVAVAHRMVALMHEAKGVGLAAPQVGLPWRLFVANPTGEPGDDRIFINPVLHNASAVVTGMEEGCLSIPDVRGTVRRPVSIRVEASDTGGKPFALDSDDLPARIWQHEVDHLDGVLIIDRMSPLDKMANRKKLRILEGGL